MASRSITPVLAVWLLIGFCGALPVAAQSSLDVSTVPRVIAFSGVARAPQSAPVTLTFRLYAGADSATPLWGGISDHRAGSRGQV